MTDFPIRLNQKTEDKSGLFSTVVIFVLAIVFIIMLLFNTLYTRIYVVGSSMQTTLSGAYSEYQAGGDYVYICKYIEPKRGDIVVIDVGERSLIKRVIALGGEKVRLECGVLYIDGELIEEPYINPANNTNMKKNTFNEIEVEEGYVFCMGDNRDNSEDSRGIYGCMPVENITGVVTGWSMQCKDVITGWNTFFGFTLPELFGAQNNL